MRIESWYLAGNRIDTTSFTCLVDAMIKSPVVTNVWLKRKPLGPESAQDIFRLITQSLCLSTLDLDQTERGDEGVATLFSLLATYNQGLPLRHIYLNATGIGHLACAQINAYLSLPSCGLSHAPVQALLAALFRNPLCRIKSSRSRPKLRDRRPRNALQLAHRRLALRGFRLF